MSKSSSSIILFTAKFPPVNEHALEQHKRPSFLFFFFCFLCANQFSTFTYTPSYRQQNAMRKWRQIGATEINEKSKNYPRRWTTANCTPSIPYSKPTLEIRSVAEAPTPPLRRPVSKATRFPWQSASRRVSSPRLKRTNICTSRTRFNPFTLLYAPSIEPLDKRFPVSEKILSSVTEHRTYRVLESS